MIATVLPRRADMSASSFFQIRFILRPPKKNRGHKMRPLDYAACVVLGCLVQRPQESYCLRQRDLGVFYLRVPRLFPLEGYVTAEPYRF